MHVIFPSSVLILSPVLFRSGLDCKIQNFKTITSNMCGTCIEY